MLHHRWLDIVLSAKWQDLIAYPLQRQQFASHIHFMTPLLPDTKSDKDAKKKKKRKKITGQYLHEYRCKNIQQNISKLD